MKDAEGKNETWTFKSETFWQSCGQAATRGGEDLKKLKPALKNLKVTYRKLDELIPYARNSREHSPTQVKQIAASIKEFGFCNPILISSQNDIVAGHGRALAAELIGLKEVPTIELGHLTDTQRKAYVIADNRLAENASWDTSLLSLEIKDLEMAKFDVDLLGFNDAFWAVIEDKTFPDNQDFDPQCDEDECPEPVSEKKPTTKNGDIWILGDHRLICGNSVENFCVEKLFDNKKADLVFTDPPYGVNYKGGAKNNRNQIENDDCDVEPFYKSFLTLAKQYSKAGASIYIWHANIQIHNCIKAAIDSGWHFKSQIVWVKNVFTLGRSDYHWQHEPAFYGWGMDGSHEWHGDRKQSTIWMINKPVKSEEHPTMKPVELCERGILNSSMPGYIVYDPFCGSGSTLIACEKTRRKCYAIEIDPIYCDVIVERWQKYTGKKAELQSEGM